MVAQHRKAKNIPLAFAIMRRLLVSNPGLALLIVGNDGPETGKIHRLLGDEPLRSRIVLLQNLTGQQLQSCYRNCELLLATSSIEGFGLPVAEAILAGAPVICSDIPAFREVGGMHCCFVRLDSFATQSFASAVREALHTKRPEAANLPHLSSPVIAEQYMQLYLSLLSMLSARAACFPQTGRRARGIA
jgi:glycosyltransferase involved in cell wall biosynthesis